ncbi:MAG: metallophosphoesterase [Microcystaceae cyanobacterium]
MNFRFAIISDLHIALPQTIEHHKKRFHLVEVSIPAFEKAIEHLTQLDLDFLLLPGDLTQDGEPENHQWLQNKLKTLPFPVYVVPGNHDVPTLLPTDKTIGLADFSAYYKDHGYDNPKQLYYTQEILPNLQLIGLNSNQFSPDGKQLGYVDDEQLIWLENLLPQLTDKVVFVMVHHNLIEHLPNQAKHELGRRYMSDNAQKLREILHKHQINLIFTGHLHVQDIVNDHTLYEITTGSLVSYPHPYRVINGEILENKALKLDIKSYRVDSIPEFPKLSETSRNYLGDRSFTFMMRLLMSSPLHLSEAEARQYAPQLRNFWADIAEGDNLFDFPDFPDSVRQHFQQFGAIRPDGTPDQRDNQTQLLLK